MHVLLYQCTMAFIIKLCHMLHDCGQLISSNQIMKVEHRIKCTEWVIIHHKIADSELHFSFNNYHNDLTFI